MFVDLYDWAKKVNECKVTTVNPARGLVMQKSSSGSTVEVNEELIALFRYDEAVYAVLERCPHAGSNAVYPACKTQSATENAAPSTGTIMCVSLLLEIGCK